MKQITINVSDSDYDSLRKKTDAYNSTTVANHAVHVPDATVEQIAEWLFHKGLAMA